MRVIHCIDCCCCAIIDVGSAHSLVPSAPPTRDRSEVSQLPNPLTGLYRDIREPELDLRKCWAARSGFPLQR